MPEEQRERYVAPEPNQMFTLGHEKWKRAGPTPLSSTGPEFLRFRFFWNTVVGPNKGIFPLFEAKFGNFTNKGL